MHLVSTIFLFLLACRESIQDLSLVIDQPLDTNFTILDNYNNNAISLGPGEDGILEIQPNSTQRWLFEQINLDYYIIRDSMTHQFIHFPELTPGAVATASKTAASVISLLMTNNALARFYINFHYYRPELYLSVEPYSAEEPNRLVLKLREYEYGRTRQEFTLIQSPGNGD